MDLMVSEGIEIRSWLYDMAIYMLCDVEEVDEALRIVQQRVEAAEHGISKSVWFNLLDVASSTYNHAAIQYIWRRQVEPGYLNPSSGICLNILATFARYGDAQLATGVFSLLSERKEVFTKQHYEMLVDTYIQAGDMRTALSVLCIMQSSGTPPDDYSTRELFRWVRAGTERAREMFDHLRSLKDEGHTVPLAAFNALLEASIYRTDLDQAIDLYKALHTVCENGPTTETFNILFRGCPRRKDLAMFLAAEMVERNVEPDALTYDRLLLICLMEQDNYDDAFRYYEEMRSRGWTPRAGTFIAMARRCARAQDPRAWELVDVMRECGVDAHSVRFVREWLDANWGKVSEADPDLTRCLLTPLRLKLHDPDYALVRAMASLLRQIVAGPRARHPEAGLDLCYVTDSIIATSGPSGTYPQRAYRNPLDQLVKFLDKNHADKWAIWEFRAEGTGYPDEEVYGRIYHYPWPDHHPPPFALVPRIVASMRNWLKADKERVVVVHCKAGKGRSGTVSCSYLIAEEGWKVEDALKRFTERRMRPSFGPGVSIPSQLRWVGYVDRWTKGGKIYVERQIEILEVHAWGIRNGVKISIDGFVDEGKVIKTFHTFTRAERQIIKGQVKDSGGLADVVAEVMAQRKLDKTSKDEQTLDSPSSPASPADRKANKEVPQSPEERESESDSPAEYGDVIFRPSKRVVLPTSDINIDFERRNKALYGYTMVTSVAHVWFNTFFEGKGPEQNGKADDSGTFELEWDKMDGIKGSSRKGARAFDKFAVVWRAIPDSETGHPDVVITEPKEGEEVPQAKPADWKGTEASYSTGTAGKELGLRTETPPDQGWQGKAENGTGSRQGIGTSGMRLTG
ncbi:Protein-tyrosine phosphatase receptor/non-receptor type [Neofusicoccum parvum]|nr:Protein-tyrosine phosphatase receptor/non-receptor type [Neofusicoccum parvum]